MTNINDVGDSAFVDPFEEDWNDDEMNAQAAEFQRLLDDADTDDTDNLNRLTTLNEDQINYLGELSYTPKKEGI